MKNRLLSSCLALALLFSAAGPARSEGETYAKVWPAQEGRSVAAKLLKSGIRTRPEQDEVPPAPEQDPPPEEAASPEEEAEEEAESSENVIWYEFELGFLDDSGHYTPFLWENGYDLITGEPLGNCAYRFCQTEREISGVDLGFYNGYICLPGPDGITSDLYDTTGRPLHVGGGTFFPVSQVTESTVVCRRAGSEAPGWYDLTAKSWISLDLSGHDNWKIAALAPFCDGLAPAAVYWTDAAGEPVGPRWGFADRNGTWAISPAYMDYMVRLPNTLHQVFVETGLALMQNPDGQWGGIDREGAVRIPFQYDALCPTEDGQISFRRGNLEGIVDLTNPAPVPTETPPSTETPETPPSTENPPPGESTPPAEDNLDGVDDWAMEEVRAAIAAGIVPPHLRYYYSDPICRDEFCDLIIWTVCRAREIPLSKLLPETTGKSFASWRANPPFRDCKNTNVTAAYALGIVNGREEGAFDPASPITREEAAVMLTRAAESLGLPVGKPARAGFTDRDQVGVWFGEGVDYVSQMGIMNGVGYNFFCPKDVYSRQQAYITALRLWKIARKE